MATRHHTQLAVVLVVAIFGVAVFVTRFVKAIDDDDYDDDANSPTQYMTRRVNEQHKTRWISEENGVESTIVGGFHTTTLPSASSISVIATTHASRLDTFVRLLVWCVQNGSLSSKFSELAPTRKGPGRDDSDSL